MLKRFFPSRQEQLAKTPWEFEQNPHEDLWKLP
jgi:hypothetical protein